MELERIERKKLFIIVYDTNDNRKGKILISHIFLLKKVICIMNRTFFFIIYR